MVKIDEAYSLDCEEIVDAEKAHELYWDGKIKDKRNFECLGCTLKITGANIDKDYSEMKNTPHFRAYGEHDKDCSYVIKHKNELVKTKKDKQKSRDFLNENLDTFHINRPNNHAIQRNTINKNSNKDMEYKNTIKDKVKQEFYNNKKRSYNYYSIRPIVSKFLNYSKYNELDNKSIIISGYKVSYEEMFMDLQYLNLNTLSKYKRILFGEGKIYRSKAKKGDYLIYFNSKYNQLGKQIMLYIKADKIEKSYNSLKWINILEDLCNKQDKILFFAYGKIEHSDKYKNIQVSQLSNLDSLDFRVI